ncbi:polygalacturonase inhibitor (DUF639) isoform X2 [Wolffia australiana]
MDGEDGIFRRFVRQRSLSSLFGRGIRGRGSSEGEDSTQIKPIPQLSLVTNSVVSRCARILRSSPLDLQKNFEIEHPEQIQNSSAYARNVLEYCSYKALQEVCKNPGYLGDKELRRLTFDMMLAWEVPGAKTEFMPKEKKFHRNLGTEEEDAGSLFYIDSTSVAALVDHKKTVGREAFCRIAPACSPIADSITVHNLFDALTSSSPGTLHFLLYEKYLGSLDKLLKAAKNAQGLPLASNLPIYDGEIILDVDGNIPIQPVLQHIGISAWPGRLTLTSHALYFESLGVGSYDKATVYDLAADSKQVVKPDLIGPLGSRLFDKAVLYKSSSLEDPVSFEFPELTGHSRRDYWLAIIHEVLYAHNFIRKYGLCESQRAEALSKAIIAILQCRAIKEVIYVIPSLSKTLLPFSLAENIPKGDAILEALHGHLECIAKPGGFLPVSTLTLCRRGLNVMKKGDEVEEILPETGAFCVGAVSPLEKAVEKSIFCSGEAETARATVEQVKVEGIDTNLAVMKGLLSPVIKSFDKFHFLSSWEDRFQSAAFLVLVTFIFLRGWFRYIVPVASISIAILMTWHKYSSKGKLRDPLKIVAPPSKNPVEQILILQEAISQVEMLVQAGNIILLKFRSILLATVPQTALVLTSSLCLSVNRGLFLVS